MQVSVETTSDLGRKMTIGIPAASIDAESQKRLQNLARNVKLNGFRPGKVPFKVVKKRYGESVRQEVMTEAMQQHFYQAIIQEKITPAGAPFFEFTQTEEGKDIEFVATFEVYPELEIKDFSEITVEKQTAEVQDEDLAKMIDTLREQRANWVEVKRKAKNDDQVTIDFEGTIDGESFAGGSAENHPLVLGSGSMIPGFEDQLVDAKAGDAVDVTVTFPEDYHANDLAGKEAVFKTTVHKVSKKELPKVGELADVLGVESGNINKMKEEVRKNMERELGNALKNRLKNQVMDELVKANDVDVPKSSIDGEIDNLRKQAIAQYGGDEKMAASLPAEMFEQQAKRRVQLGLIVGAIINSKELKPDADRVETQLNELASVYEQPEEVIEYYKADQSRMSQIEQLVLEDMVIEAVLAEAKVTDVDATFDEVMNQK
ncbi:trigger factor [Pleionea sp. CnH1-48]|uniref:trigger factor n=1 Tax=Pleionea sp. CnH1-48 TaxID=2954494 RepID=UPI0020985BDB|nr:trigger factor [Pleionea sp. CnH1-48]MCO7225459.1 trigger factor [Pleionea sp. CnH1-48]